MTDLPASQRPYPVPPAPMRFATPQAMPPSRPSDGEGSAWPLIKLVLHALQRWWKAALLAALVLAAAGGWVGWQTYEPVYRAEAWLEMTREYIIHQPDRDQRSDLSQLKVALTLPTVTREVLSDPKIAGSPTFRDASAGESTLRSKLRVSAQGRSNFFTVSYESPHRGEVADVVNRTIEAYFTRSVDRGSRQDRELLQRLRDVQGQWERKIAEKRDQILAQIRANKGVATIDVEAGLGEAVSDGAEVADDPNGLIAWLSRETHNLQGELLRAKAKQDATTQLIENNELDISPDMVEATVEARPEIVALAQDITRRERELAAMEKNANPSGEIYRRNVSDLQRRRDQLKETRDRLRSLVEVEMRQSAEDARANLRQEQQTEIAVLESKLRYFRLELEKAERFRVSDREGAFQVALDRDEMARLYKTKEQIAARIDAIEIEQRADNGMLVDRWAETPDKPIDKGPLVRTATFALPGLALPFALAFLWELRRRPVTDAADLEQNGHTPVLAEISPLPTESVLTPRGSKRFGIALSRFEESIDYLRTSIHLIPVPEAGHADGGRADAGRSVRSLAICSATAREGKTTVAAHLASSMSREGRGRTLLIDADLRRPYLHNLIGGDGSEAGLAEVLAGLVPVQEAIATTWIENLDFLPAGVLDSSPSGLVRTDLFQSLFEQLYPLYTAIVIDTPPVMAVYDAMVIARAADGVLMCSLRDHSRTRLFEQASAKLRASGANIVGAALSGAGNSAYESCREYYYQVRSEGFGKQRAGRERVRV